jgi:hypothetical protein
LNDETEKFIARAKAQNLEWSLQNSGADEPTYGPWSQGKCAAKGCGSDLEVVRVEQSVEHATYVFACGHRLVTKELLGVAACASAFQGAALTPALDGQTVQARRAGFAETTLAHEFSMVQTFAALFRPELVKIDKLRIDSKVVENTPIDIVAESEDGSIRESFQVTRLYDSPLWQQVKVNERADLVIKFEELVSFLSRVLADKNYDANERKRIILLIDTWPGVLPDLAKKVSEAVESQLEQASFKEVWLLNKDRDQSFRIWDRAAATSQNGEANRN